MVNFGLSKENIFYFIALLAYRVFDNKNQISTRISIQYFCFHFIK